MLSESESPKREGERGVSRREEEEGCGSGKGE